MRSAASARARTSRQRSGAHAHRRIARLLLLPTAILAFMAAALVSRGATTIPAKVRFAGRPASDASLPNLGNPPVPAVPAIAAGSAGTASAHTGSARRASDPSPAPRTPEEILLAIRRDVRDGRLAEHGEAYRALLAEWAQIDPRRVLAAVRGELDPATVGFALECLRGIRRAEQLAAIEADLVDLACRHPGQAHRTGALNLLAGVLWHHRDQLAPASEVGLVGCVRFLSEREDTATREAAARMLLALGDRPEVERALTDFVASGDIATDAARAEVLSALVDRLGAEAAGLAVARLREDRSPAVAAAAVAALCRLDAEDRDACRAEIVAAARAVLGAETDPARRLPALLGLALADPRQAAPYFAGADACGIEAAARALDRAAQRGAPVETQDSPELGELVALSLREISDSPRASTTGH